MYLGLNPIFLFGYLVILSKSVRLKFKLKKGGIVVFPSFVWHRVKPVTKGIRYSLVVWILGQPFK